MLVGQHDHEKSNWFQVADVFISYLSIAVYI